MTLLLQISLIFLVILLAESGFIRNKWGADVESVEPCPNNDKLVNPIRNLKFLRYNRTLKTVSYDFSYDRPLDETVGGSVSVARWGDGGWIDIPFMSFQPYFCKYMQKYFFRDNWIEFHKNIGIKNPDKCPIPAGNYSVKNYVINTGTYNFPFFSGRFKTTITMQDVKTRQDLICYIYIVKVVEVVD